MVGQVFIHMETWREGFRQSGLTGRVVFCQDGLTLGDSGHRFVEFLYPVLAGMPTDSYRR